MLLEKYEKFLELSIKTLVMQSNLTSSIFVGQTVRCVKNQMLMVFVVKVRYFLYLARVIQA